MYFVDGRFRVACALQAFLHGVSDGRTRDDFVVLIHDFVMDQAKRGYQVLLEVADLVDGSAGNAKRKNNLAALRRKEGVSDEKLKAMLEKYKYIQE
jgi:protein O-GlcNAc transferase